MKGAALVLALTACSTVVAPEPVEPCVTYVVTELGDTVAFVDLEVPPENLNGVVLWWIEGDCPGADHAP